MDHLDLESFSEEEKAILLNVIKRDEELRKEQDNRVTELKTEIHNLRMQSALKEGEDLSKICARCHKPFGFLFNKGDTCSQCRFKVCSDCRESLLSGKWLCSLCYKQVQLKGLTGEWINDAAENDNEKIQNTKSMSGTELVKASLGQSIPNGKVASDHTDPSKETYNKDVNPEVKVTGDPKSETESHGGDSGHISGTSADNTPEHKSTHLSIPSIGNTSASVEEASPKDSRESLYSVYSDAGEINYGRIPVSGEILFGLDYNYKTGALEIHVKQCKEISPVDVKRNRSDPYVKTYLLPDKTRSGKRKTKIKKHTLNPTFDEVIQYVISKSEVENRVLWVTVWHQERFGHNDFLGEVMIPLDCYKFGDASPVWYTLQERPEAPGGSQVVYKGDLLVSLKYVPPEDIEVFLSVSH